MEQNKDDKKPALPIPTLKDSKSIPQMKIKGLAQGGLSLLERLKAFKKKDLAFILAGLGVLFLAPLAEHFMMAPEGDQGGFKEGFGSRGEGGAFGKGGSPYDGGVNGLAPGGAIGNGSDVITPLNVRDPAALVMGPGATQQPAASSLPTPAAPPAKADGDWKDALKESASRAATAAAPKAALPMPKVPLSAGGLRGLGAVSGGGGGSYSLPALNASNVPNRGNVNSSPAATGGGGIRGVGARGLGQGGDPNSLEALKKAAGNAAGNFNAGGSASQNLEQAAKTQFGDGQGGGMGEGNGAGDKAAGQSGSKDSKNADGQSLAFLKAKQEQEKAIEFEWKKKEAGDLDLLWFKLRDKMAEELIMTPLKAVTGRIGKALTKLGTNAAGTYQCFPVGADGKVVQDGSGVPQGAVQITDDQIGQCFTSPSKDDQEAGSKDAQYYFMGPEFKGSGYLYGGSKDCNSQSTRFLCSGGTPDKKPPVQDPTAVGGSGGISSDDLGTICQQLNTMISQGGTVSASASSVAGSAAGTRGTALVDAATKLKTAAANVVAAQNAMKNGPVPNKCDASVTVAQSDGRPIAVRLQKTNADVNAMVGDLGKARARYESASKDLLGAVDGGAINTADMGKAPLAQDTAVVRKFFTDALVSPSADDSADAAIKAVNGQQQTPMSLAQMQADIKNNVYKDPDYKNLDTLIAGYKNQGLAAVATDLTETKRQLADVQAKLQAASTSLGLARTAVNGLTGADAATGSDFTTKFLNPVNDKGYTVQFQEFQNEAADYNRMSGPNGGLALTKAAVTNTIATYQAQEPHVLTDTGMNLGAHVKAMTSVATDLGGQTAITIPAFKAPAAAGTPNVPPQDPVRVTWMGDEKSGTQITAIANTAGLKTTYDKFTPTAGANATGPSAKNDDPAAPYLAPHIGDVTGVEKTSSASIDAAKTQLQSTPAVQTPPVLLDPPAGGTTGGAGN